MSPKSQERIEQAGYVCAVAGLGCLGWAIAGPVLAAAFGLIALAALLIFVGNI